MKLNDEVVRLLVDEAMDALEPIAVSDADDCPQIELSEALARTQRAMDSLGVARTRIRQQRNYAGEGGGSDANDQQD